jgi:Monooxygenase af470-like
MAPGIERTTVDLSKFPDLVVIYLGMRVRSLRGLKTVVSFGPKIAAAVSAKPDGLLLHESLFYSVYPLHVGMRQYWRDFSSLENWARSLPHQEWWKEFLKDSGGVGFWHETYFIRGGMEAIYDDLPAPLGFSAFAPKQPARGPMFNARKRLGVAGEPAIPTPVSEDGLQG